MGSINPGNIGPVNLASSIAGAQKNQSTNQAKEAASEKTFKMDIKTMAAQASGDVTEAELETDRDADGRMPMADGDHQDQEESTEESSELPVHKRSTDAFHEKGNQLDLDA